MATRSKTITVHVCHGCGKDCDYPTKCGRCTEAFCYECRDKQCITYRHSVYCQGSGDVTYCLPCDAILAKKPDALYLALLKISNIRAEAERWNKDFKERSEQAERDLQNLQKGIAA